MHRHAVRLGDFAIALATCAAFSVAILGDLATHNLEFINANDFPRPLYVLLGLNALFCAASYLLGWRHALHVWPLALFLIFRFGEVSSQIIDVFLQPVVSDTPERLELLWIGPLLSGAALLSIVLLWSLLLRTRMREPRHATWILLFFALGTAYPSIDGASVLLREAYQSETDDSVARPEDVRALKTARPEHPLPDVIVLIPDRYPSNRVLRDSFDYDNKAFSDALAERGFVVLDDLRANYQSTLMSLVSSLNLRNLEMEEGKSRSINGLYAGLYRNLVAQALTRNGYEYVHLGGWAGFTMRSPLADRVYNGTHFIVSYLNELETQLLMLTPLAGAYLAATEWNMGWEGHETYECRRLKRQLEYLRALERSERPLFAWAHIYIPHNPLTMDAQGNCLPHPLLMPSFKSVEAMNDKEEVAKFMSHASSYRKMFLEYMEVFNREALAIFDAQEKRSRKHGRELIFMVLADEGSYPILWMAVSNDKFLHERSAPHVLREKFGIFGAIYANRIEREHICTLRSRVNAWRMIINNVLGTNFQPVDDIAHMESEEPETLEGRRYFGKMQSIRDRLEHQVLGGKGCEGALKPNSYAPD